jgi:energy-coupling factor transport system permease protein
VALSPRLSAVPAAALLAALAAAALIAERAWTVAAIAVILFVTCLHARARSRVYLVGALSSAVGLLLLTPLLVVQGTHVLWRGPIVPVIGELDVTREELASSAVQALRLAAVTLAFAVYALLVDHDRLVRAAGAARRSVLAVALATRLLPTLQRDAAGLVVALRGRGVDVRGTRGRARLLGPLLAGSLERGLGLAEAMEARGFGRPGKTTRPAKPWTLLDWAAVAAAAAIVLGGFLWL